MSRVFFDKLNTVEVAKVDNINKLLLEGIVVKLPNKSLFMTWTAADDREQTIFSVTKYSQSFDGGKTWSKGKVLFSHPIKGLFSPCVYVDDAGVLYVYFKVFSNYFDDQQTFVSKSTDCGKTFSTPVSLHGCIDGSIHIKQAVKVGKRYLMPFSWMENRGKEWAHPTMGNPPKPCIIGGKKGVHKAYRFAEGITTESVAWHFRNRRSYIGVIAENEHGWLEIIGRLSMGEYNIVEPCIVELSDGTLVMYFRTTIKAIIESRSFDGGITWTEPKPTDIPSPETKIRLFKDKSGAIYLLHNPDTVRRSPLSLWVSYDDMKTWDVKIDLIRDDEKMLCYPDGFIDEENNRLCISWEDRKSVYFSTISLDDVHKRSK